MLQLGLLTSLALAAAQSETCAPDETLDRVVRATDCTDSALQGPESRFPAPDLDCVFRALYQGSAGYGGTEELAEETRKMLAYGELRPGAFAHLAAGSGLFGVPLSSGDRFVDLGSGTGKLPIQAFLHGAKAAHGIELAQHRHDLGVEAIQLLQKLVGGTLEDATLTLDSRQLELTAGSLLDFKLAEMTVVYAASLCFPEELMDALAAHLRQLQPGAIFWTLKELPPGRHPGLAFVGYAAAASTWDPGAKIMVYSRVPEAPLPELPTRMEKKELLLWAAKFVAEISERLREVCNSCESGPDCVLTESSFDCAAAVLGAKDNRAGSRLMKAFAARSARSDADRCGCTPSNAPVLSLPEAISLFGRGAFPADPGAIETCLSSSGSCSLADIFVERVYFELRSRALCITQPESRSCGRMPEAGSLGRDKEITKTYACSRLSDGRSLFQVGVTSRSQDVAEFILAKVGQGAALCADHNGFTALHLASTLDEPAMLHWLLAELDGTDIRRQGLKARDIVNRTPALFARSEAAQSALRHAEL